MPEESSWYLTFNRVLAFLLYLALAALVAGFFVGLTQWIRADSLVWAGWAQAVGSVFAVAAIGATAVWQSKAQYDNALRLQLRADHRRVSNLRDVLRALVLDAFVLAKECEPIAAKAELEWPADLPGSARLDQILATINSLPLLELQSTGIVFAVISVRTKLFSMTGLHDLRHRDSTQVWVALRPHYLSLASDLQDALDRIDEAVAEAEYFLEI